MTNPMIYADFQNADVRGRLRLNCNGTQSDMARRKVMLRDGLQLTFYCEELEADGVVRFSPEEHLWVGEIDWKAIRRRPVESSRVAGVGF